MQAVDPHIAFGSTRVMATCASNGQAVAAAAVECLRHCCTPRDLLQPDLMRKLQQRLLSAGQHIPGIAHGDSEDLARQAQITASSRLSLSTFALSTRTTEHRPYALLLPLPQGRVPKITLYARAVAPAVLTAELWSSHLPGNTTPDLHLSSQTVVIHAGDCVPVVLDFGVNIDRAAHCFVMVPAVDGASFYYSDLELPGFLAVSQKANAAVAKSAVQAAPEGSGIDSFAFWLPDRRPAPRSLAATFEPALNLFDPENVANGFNRPWCGVNAWLPALDDTAPELILTWPDTVSLRKICVTFDTDFDHPMESVLMGHPERVMPGCVRSFMCIADGNVLAKVEEHHQTRWELHLAVPLSVEKLSLHITGWGDAPPAIFAVACY